jgi:hypothetical protein
VTLEGRVILSYLGYARQGDLIQRGARIGAAKRWYDKRWYDKPHHHFYVVLRLAMEGADPTPERQRGVVGVAGGGGSVSGQWRRTCKAA